MIKAIYYILPKEVMKDFQSNRMNTMRINKINDILSQELDMQGVKIFDLHLLNMGK